MLPDGDSSYFPNGGIDTFGQGLDTHLGGDLSLENDVAPAVTVAGLPSTATVDVYDLVCVGFGPTSLAVAVALQDALEYPTIPLENRPKVVFIERQAQFSWHAGMQLVGAKMQISFLKDFATLRNPRSRFTFLNYLWAKNRLHGFANLNTFIPLRSEYQDYMAWCAKPFEKSVRYGQEVIAISPATTNVNTGKVDSFDVTSKAIASEKVSTYRTKHVVLAAGGRPNIPATFWNSSLIQENLIHSSQYMTALPRLISHPRKDYRVAVVGGGQSGAEIFNDLQTQLPTAQVSLLIKAGALKPRDDSPFVNEMFEPHQIANVFHRESSLREASIAAHKDTNYGVVTLELLEQIYQKLYTHSTLHETPQHQILRYRTVVSAEPGSAGSMRLKCRNSTALYEKCNDPVDEILEFDFIILATGYTRDLHTKILEPLKHLLPDTSKGDWVVQEDYRVCFEETKVDGGKAGIWLQGCNERTHGLSDTILSLLAHRGGQLVESIFGNFGVTTT